MKILCDRLRQVYNADDWTLLEATGPWDYIAAMALIELGPRVIPLLTPLLDDNQAINWTGGPKRETVELPCRADLAYRYIMILRDQDPLYDVSVHQRDLWVRQLKQELKDKSSFTAESKDRVNRKSRLRPGG